ncbi:MAG: hypothetical protein JRI99_01340 [Deltaproteobacteria bacterium]|nr:hypothetical protein [Deltaproteobacteria bacterium]
MKIAFLHYHLKTGGVTTVIRQQANAVKDNCDVLIIAGEPPPIDFPVDVTPIPGLGYDQTLTQSYDPHDVADAVINAITEKFGGLCDVLHVHNPLLAKNKNLLTILKRLQEKGIKLFLQIHDFAEDGRPLIYYREDEYPENCHYGCINSRDFDILIQSGLTERGLHKVENVITPIHYNGPNPPAKEIVVYPIRAIRRKNIGEATLLTLFFKNNETLMITQPPNSREDIKSYVDWKAYVKQNRLNVVFEAGLSNDFSELVHASQYMITTSISEGFGFSFLEPWTAGKNLWGRILPEICADFLHNHIRLEHLYRRLMVPVEWVGHAALEEKWINCQKEARAFFKQAIVESEIEDQFHQITANDLIDFGMLDEDFQKKVLSRIISSPPDKRRLTRLNPCLSTPGVEFDTESLIHHNKDAVMSHYNPENYAEKLMAVYSKVMNRSVRHRIDKTVLLSRFMVSKYFNLLKWSRYIE